MARSARLSWGTLTGALARGARTRGEAKRLVWIGAVVFCAGAALSVLVALPKGRPWVPVAETTAWAGWLVARLAVMRLVVGPDSEERSSSVTGAWAVGLLPFGFAVEYFTSVLMGWMGSTLLTWTALKNGPVGPRLATRAVATSLAMEVTVLVGVILLRNLAVLGSLLGA